MCGSCKVGWNKFVNIRVASVSVSCQVVNGHLCVGFYFFLM